MRDLIWSYWLYIRCYFSSISRQDIHLVKDLELQSLLSAGHRPQSQGSVIRAGGHVFTAKTGQPIYL